MWVTIHDPQGCAIDGYEKKSIPPAKYYQNGYQLYVAGHNMLRAHAAAFRTYDTKFRHIQKGN